MASFILSRLFLVLLFALISLFSRISEAKSSFSFTSFGKNATFESDEISLYGDAKLVDGGSSIQLTDSVSQSGGRVIYKKPIEFIETKSEYSVGFSTFFSFSISPGKLGFVVFPVNGTFDHPLFEVIFKTSENLTSFGVNVAAITDDTIVSKKIGKFTIENLKKTKKEKLLYAWINYLGSGKFLEIRLSKSESYNSVDPLIYYPIDLSDNFMVGVKSYKGNLNLNSWSLEVRTVPKSAHSYLPTFLEKEEEKQRRRKTIWEIMTCFIMTFGSTGLVFFALMYIWAVFKRSKSEDCGGLKTKVFEYKKMEKMEVVMSKVEVQQGK